MMADLFDIAPFLEGFPAPGTKEAHNEQEIQETPSLDLRM
jgi:hypothetical protein